MAIKVRVTAEDIAAGSRDIFAPRHCWECPIARALARATGRRWQVSRGTAQNEEGGRMHLPPQAYFWEKEYDLSISAPTSADAFHATTPLPFEFEVEA